MDKILKGVHDFRTKEYPKNRKFYEQLAADHQKPRALFITCSDSRVLPNVITQTVPGELFQIRNAGNLIPPFGASMGGEVATIEYAVSVLKVKNIIVCGHSQCGAIKALVEGKVPDDMLGLKAWFHHAEATRKIMQIKHRRKRAAERLQAVTEENVLNSIRRCRPLPIWSRLPSKLLRCQSANRAKGKSVDAVPSLCLLPSLGQANESSWLRACEDHDAELKRAGYWGCQRGFKS